MQVMSWEKLFGPITGKRKPHLHISKAVWHTCDDDTMLDGITYAKGSLYKFFDSSDFGYIVFKADSKTPEGHTPGKFWHKY